MKLKKLNMRGFSHIVLPILVVVIFAIGGAGYLVASHADPLIGRLYINPPSQSAPVGTVINEAITVNTAGLPVNTVQTTLTYPAADYTLENFVPNPNFSVFHSSNQAGVFNISVRIANPNAPATGIQTIGTVSLLAIAAGPSSLNLTAPCPPNVFNVSCSAAYSTTDSGQIIGTVGNASNTITPITAPPVPTPPPASTAIYTYVGKAVVASANNTVSAYACVTKLTNTEWVTTAFYELASSYKQPAGYNWVAGLSNTGTTPLPGNQSLSQNFIDDATKPAAAINILSNPNGLNPLTFSYSTTLNGTTTSSGVIASGLHPVDLKTCAGGVPGS